MSTYDRLRIILGTGSQLPMWPYLAAAGLFYVSLSVSRGLRRYADAIDRYAGMGGVDD